MPSLYGGTIWSHDKRFNTFRLIISKRDEVILLKFYFSIYPSHSNKLIRINLIYKFYDLIDLKAHLADSNSVLGKDWSNLINEWNKDFK